MRARGSARRATGSSISPCSATRCSRPWRPRSTTAARCGRRCSSSMRPLPFPPALRSGSGAAARWPSPGVRWRCWRSAARRCTPGRSRSSRRRSMPGPGKRSRWRSPRSRPRRWTARSTRGRAAARLRLGLFALGGVLARRFRLRVVHPRPTQLVRGLRSEQQLRVREARLAERARIAREMHDVLAHRISLLSVHAGALEVSPDAPRRGGRRPRA